MSYELADVSMSTDYKIGDEFTRSDCGSVILNETNGLPTAWFRPKNTGKYLALHWENLKYVKTKKHASVINQLHETIRQLKATIKELES